MDAGNEEDLSVGFTHLLWLMFAVAVHEGHWELCYSIIEHL